MGKNKAILDWHLFLECNCGETLDLSDSVHDVDGCFSVPIFNNRWDDAVGEEAICPKCKKLVVIESVEY